MLYPRTVNGRPIAEVQIDGKAVHQFTSDAIVIPTPPRDREISIGVKMSD